MEFKATFDFTERHGVAERLERLIYEYAKNYNRYPELILIDVYSLVSLSDKGSAAAMQNLKQSFMGINLQAVETVNNLILLQRSRSIDILADANFHLEKIKKESINLKY